MADIILFWHEWEQHGFLSNWYDAPFVSEGIRYRHVEQYMMAKKALLFGDLDSYRLEMETVLPAECKALGRLIKGFDPTVWDPCREEIVYNANLAKFTQHPDLAALLKATGNAVLAEANPVDAIWGIALAPDDPLAADPANWQGQNLLGKILMRIREEL